MPQTKPKRTWAPPANSHDWNALESAAREIVTQAPPVPDNSRHRRLTANGYHP
jgi:hypothetical protein